MTTELDDRIRATVHTIAHCAADPIPWSDLSVPRNAPEPVRHRRRRRNFIAATAAAALVAAAAFGAVQLRTSATDPERPATTHAGEFNEVVDVTRAVDAPCPSDTPAEARPVQFRTETWGSDRLGRYRAQVTPATGGTHDTLIEKYCT